MSTERASAFLPLNTNPIESNAERSCDKNIQFGFQVFDVKTESTQEPLLLSTTTLKVVVLSKWPAFMIPFDERNRQSDFVHATWLP